MGVDKKSICKMHESQGNGFSKLEKFCNIFHRAFFVAGTLGFFQFVPIFSESGFKHINLVAFRSKATYIIGKDVQTFTAERTVKPFAMNRYETTYGLWYATRVKAEEMGYSFLHKGLPGSSGKIAEKPDDYSSCLPVTMVSWHDVIVWCNALSEIMELSPCYTYKGEVLRNSADARCDLAECDFSANGFRLPTEAEWEFASRRTKYGLQAGNLVSGQIDKKGKSDPKRDYTELVWDVFNSDCARPVGIAGTLFELDEIAECGTGCANGAGIFDMSGNVLEWCWDWFAEYTETDGSYGPDVGEERVVRGGSFSEYTPFIFCGDRYYYNPSEMYNFMGFRICQSK